MHILHCDYLSGRKYKLKVYENGPGLASCQTMDLDRLPARQWTWTDFLPDKYM